MDGLLPLVLPSATRFSAPEGNPPIYRAYQGDKLVGYAWRTSDWPPEEMGYSGTIDVVVGMDLSARITGVRVIDYNESLRSSRGDFLRQNRYIDQFAGKTVTDPFRVRMDVDGISGATISVSAMSRGIRNSARRVATTHLAGALDFPDPIHPAHATADKLRGVGWLEMIDAGVVQRLSLLDRDRSAVELYFVYLHDAVGEMLMGEAYWAETLERAGERAGRDHMFMVGIDGPLGELYRATATYLIQDDDTTRMSQGDLLLLGPPNGGKTARQFTRAGVLLVDSTLVDAKRPFEFLLDLSPMGAASALFPGLTPPAARVMAAAPDAPAGGDGGGAESSAGDSATAATGEGPAGADAAGEDAEPSAAAAEEAAIAASLAEQIAQADALDFAFEEEEQSVLGRTLAQTSWGRVVWMVLLLSLAGAAFALKRPALRWAALAVTVVGLGFVDGGFLSVSHITSGIKVGPSVYLNDLPLLLLGGFTVVTTLFWGRVFCGFLCPFGALQDFVERVVPKAWRRDLPRAIHERAWLVKYGVLALIVIAAFTTDVSIFQYFEPFGTVFFLSTSWVLWAIAGVILVATVVVPRFYCRYVCPLGASLAVVSSVSPFRIRRVEQCGVCTVCERKCPTGAIQREKVSFRECVRCNACETALIDRVGVCKHDMEEVRPRLVQLKAAAR